MSLYSQLAKTDPKDLDLQNNLAMAALLLDAQEIKPHDIAREAYTKSPTNSSYASTYAFSLYLQNKPKDALQICQKIDPTKLEDASNANYYGLILKAAGNPAEAKKYFALGAKAPMLPEEKKLFDKAKSGL